MRLKEIKAGMAVKCRTKEEAMALWTWFFDNGYVRSGIDADCLDNFLSCFSDSRFYINESENSWGTFAEDIADVKKVEFSDLIIPELTAEEALLAYDQMCKENYCCNDCPIYGILGHECAHKMDGHITEIVDVIKKWKADREKKEPETEKKEPEIETVDICRIIEVLPDGRKRCVHEEDLASGSTDAEIKILVEAELKHYCMEHDGEYIAVHEAVSRVKEKK